MSFEIKCNRDEWDEMYSALGYLLGKRGSNQGTFQNLIDANEALEDAEELCDNKLDYDVDGVVSFTFDKRADVLRVLEDDFDTLYSYSKDAVDLVEDIIDRPFHKSIGIFIDKVEDVRIEVYNSVNYVGNYYYSQGQGEPLAHTVQIHDVFTSDTIYAEAAHAKYEEWLETNEDISYEEWLDLYVINSEYFTYESVSEINQDQRQKMLKQLLLLLLPYVNKALADAIDVGDISLEMGIPPDMAEKINTTISYYKENPECLKDDIRNLFP